jgi:hypothetical protein
VRVAPTLHGGIWAALFVGGAGVRTRCDPYTPVLVDKPTAARWRDAEVGHVSSWRRSRVCTRAQHKEDDGRCTHALEATASTARGLLAAGVALALRATVRAERWAEGVRLAAQSPNLRPVASAVRDNDVAQRSERPRRPALPLRRAVADEKETPIPGGAIGVCGARAAGLSRTLGAGVGSGVRRDVGAPIGRCVTGAGVDRRVPGRAGSIQPRVACDVWPIAGQKGGIEAQTEGRPGQTPVSAGIPCNEAFCRRGAELGRPAPPSAASWQCWTRTGLTVRGPLERGATNLAARAVRALRTYGRVLACIESAIDAPIEGGRCNRTRIGFAVVGRRQRGAARQGGHEQPRQAANRSALHGSTVAPRSSGASCGALRAHELYSWVRRCRCR